MNHLELVNLDFLMERTKGRTEIAIVLLDGPVALDHPDLAGQNIRTVAGELEGICTLASSRACIHGTFIAGILCGKRGSAAPAICPNCTLLVKPIFSEGVAGNNPMPVTT